MGKKTAELVSSWGLRDNRRLVAKQISIRLPVHIAARVAALGDVFPTKTRSDIISDLLGAALDDVEASMPRFLDEEHAEDVEGTMLAPYGGKYGEYVRSANDHFSRFEKELGNKRSGGLFTTHEKVNDKR